jgi:hypothetical protein
MGSLQVAKAISNYSSCKHLSLNSHGIYSVNDWVLFLKNKNILGVFCGTSQSDDGFRFEKHLRVAAFKLKLPIICIEDFPGNYRDVSDTETSLLILDNEFSLDLYKSRGVKVPNYLIFTSVRYDYIRSSDAAIQEKYLYSSVLWAGQPEFQYNYNTLIRIAPKLKELSVVLMFRAHPGDSEYHNGVYAKYFDSLDLPWFDVTNKLIGSDLFQKISLVITQFSSLGIEAGFYGVPTVNVLFNDIGRQLLLKKTGSDELMAVHYNASFLIKDKISLENMKFFLTDLSLRAEVMKNFNELYKLNEKQLPKLFSAIRDII